MLEDTGRLFVLTPEKRVVDLEGGALLVIAQAAAATAAAPLHTARKLHWLGSFLTETNELIG